MDKVAEYRAQEMLCRVRASFDQPQQMLWLSEAEEWRRRAQREISFHFRAPGSMPSEDECDRVDRDTQAHA
jgi:hypothetical protein